MRNYFAALRTPMEFADSKENTHNGDVGEQRQLPPGQAGSPPPIVLTAETNLILLQKNTTKRTSERKLV